MNQLEFPIVETPAARSTDPATSHLAAEHITKTNKRRRQQQVCADLVKQHPGHTARELACLTKADHEMLHKRLPELVTAGVVRKGSRDTRCSVTNRMATVWWPVAKELT